MSKRDHFRMPHGLDKESVLGEVAEGIATILHDLGVNENYHLGTLGPFSLVFQSAPWSRLHCKIRAT